MALASPHRIVEDDPSEVVRLTRKELNKLLDAFAVLVAASQEADFAAFKAAAEDADVALQKVLTSFERPTFPEAPQVA